MILSEADQKRISASIKSAEAKTSGEIVCVLARASSNYMSFTTAWAALICLIIPWFLIALTNLSVERILLAQIIIFVVLFLVFSESTLQRILIPRTVRRSMAHRVAMEQFMIRGMARKKNRASVLIFASLAEHYARIIADVGIASKVNQSVWQDAIQSLLDCAGRGDIGQGFTVAIDKCGQVLSQHFPPEPKQEDELPDRIYVI